MMFSARLIMLIVFCVLQAGCAKTPSVSSRSGTVMDIAERGSNRGKDRILVFVKADYAPELLEDKELNEFIWSNYYYESISLSHIYDEKMLRAYVANQKRAGNFRNGLSFDEYLLIRDQAFTVTDVEIIKHLRLTQTPELVIIDERGQVIDRYSNMTSDPMFGEMVRRNAFHGKSERELDAMLWSLDQESDRASLFAFLRRNAF